MHIGRGFWMNSLTYDSGALPERRDKRHGYSPNHRHGTNKASCFHAFIPLNLDLLTRRADLFWWIPTKVWASGF